MPPAAAFSNPGALLAFLESVALANTPIIGAPQLIWPPVLGKKDVRWSEVFSLIKQPRLLWDCWKPSKSLNQFASISEIWECYTLGEPMINVAGEQTGVKPPLQLVEKHFRFNWRTGGPPVRIRLFA